jgi:transposase InsO family protein
MCKVLKVSRNAYYSWFSGTSSKKEDVILNSLIKSAFYEFRQVYGARRLKGFLLNEYGLIISRRRVSKIMKTQSLRTKHKRRFKVITTDSKHNYSISPNRLKRDFYVSSPNKAYVGDITYIHTKEGWQYLATVIDLYSRSVVGYAIDNRMHTRLIVSALTMAQAKRINMQGVIFHSDRGSQYASDEFRVTLNRFGIIQSMSAKGDCWDNAVAESFFKTIKTELIYHTKFNTQQEAVRAIEDYINFYNNKRIHSYNGYLSPATKEARWWVNYYKNERIAA